MGLNPCSQVPDQGGRLMTAVSKWHVQLSHMAAILKCHIVFFFIVFALTYREKLLMKEMKSGDSLDVSIIYMLDGTYTILPEVSKGEFPPLTIIIRRTGRSSKTCFIGQGFPSTTTSDVQLLFWGSHRTRYDSAPLQDSSHLFCTVNVSRCLSHFGECLSSVLH